jgi:predicted RNase H-like nuclease (RuvC/YqgF family)
VDEFGILVPREPGGLDVKVSAETLDRALLIMAEVIAVLERQGHRVEISDHGHTFALIDGQQVQFGVEEPIRKVVTQKARVPNPTDRWDYDEVVTHEPAGKLVLAVRAETWGQFQQRRRWNDAKVQRLENLIPDVISGLIRTAVSLRKQEEERIRREAEEKRRKQEREKLRQDIQEEEKKLEQLEKWVDGWNRADRMRRFIAAYEEKSRSWPIEKQSQCKAWMEWANRQADWIDPLVPESPKSVLDRKHEFSWW